MACFIVPATEAVVTKVISKCVENVEKDKEISDTQIPLSTKIGWLTKLLSGGSVLLAFEHVWHGEVVPWFPFLTAASNHEDFVQMVKEMATVGVSMAGVVTLIWGGMLIASSKIMKKQVKVVK